MFGSRKKWIRGRRQVVRKWEAIDIEKREIGEMLKYGSDFLLMWLNDLFKMAVKI